MIQANLADLIAFPSFNVSMVILLAKATVILLAALGITLAMRRASAGARHLVWLVTLGALLLVPALSAWAPLRLEVLPPVVAALPAGSQLNESSASEKPSTKTRRARRPQHLRVPTVSPMLPNSPATPAMYPEAGTFSTVYAR
ncbi:MAG: hypothetical protein H0T48_14190 [Gemmatimonadaceae bacterium]|nr:hypothetical protein [Gemmatimonadaceae bacterium]